ncbi:MAG TPA: anthranilate synthase component I family protein [Candidatus Thermoplasmatota archaeon]|nr:anthranilate synthase component I family protein [Candidatus Thermoplasmatota archaeon]
MDCFELLWRDWREGEPAVFLDGAAASAPEAVRRMSYLALRPSASLCVREAEAWWREGAGPWRRRAGDPWALLRALRGPASDGAPLAPFVAGLASYDAGRLIERLPGEARDDTALPWLLFHRFDDVTARTFRSASRLDEDEDDVEREGKAQGEGPSRSTLPSSSVVRIGPIEPQLSQKEFEAMVVRAKAYIRAGDVFQVNLSHRLECDVSGSPLDLYARLRAVNPAPFSAFFASGPLPWDPEGFHVLSSSPERLFSLRAGRLEARPIAGTRRRDPDPARDAALRVELRADAKEQAEHVMMVDLARNDLGRVARFGSVRVPDLLTVETYRTVHHLVSVVDAQLADGKDAIDALRAMFPGGTITGAPKVRAMEVIEELEPARRGIYTGSLGFFDGAGDADFNILIRTILVQKRRAHLQVGAGIVEESEPHKEYEETLAKAKGLLLALGRDA